MDDLVEWNGLYYKKFTDVPFSGKTTGQTQGSFKKGKKDGPWVEYYGSGKLRSKGTYKDDKKHGPWVGYYDNEQLLDKGTYKDGKEHGPWVADGSINPIYTGTYWDGVMAV